MAPPSAKTPVYLEIGAKKVFAGALDWPGWCRSGRDEAGALQALLDYGSRYGRILSRARLGFRAPATLSGFAVVERLKGNATTDFGAPGLAPAYDAHPMDAAELKRCQAVLKACWRAFDSAVEAARGKSLRLGPRGGGRNLDGIVRHVLGGEDSYLSALGWPHKWNEAGDPLEELERIRKAILPGLAAAARGEIPARGPRGGLRWTARYYTRRAAWHVLDHVWEIEDRVAGGS